MKTKTSKLFLSAVAAMVLTTSVMACKNSCDGQKMGCNYEKSCQMENKSCHSDGKMQCHTKGKKHKDGSKFIIGAVYALDLSKEQEGKIDQIVSEYKSKKAGIYAACTDEGFDKEKYIHARMNKKREYDQTASRYDRKNLFDS